jgi:hypothetical protein
VIAELLSFSEPAAKRRSGLWGMLAVANLTYGVLLARDPARTDDFLTVLSWASAWLLRGVNLYTPEWAADYPPHAIVTLAPLSLIPASFIAWVWVAVNVLLAVAVPWLALRVMCPDAPRWGRIEVTLLFLCWSGTKILTQYSLLMLALSLIGMWLADLRPVASGVAIGLALMKPQIAFPVFLWVALARRWKIVSSAAVAVAVGWLVYAARAGLSPVTLVTGYISVLQTYYTGPTAVRGVSNLRPLFEQFTTPEAAEPAAASAALLMLAIIVGLASRRRRDDRLLIPALGGVWSLSTVYHLTYGFILLLPASILLRLDRGTRDGVARRAIFWIVQAALIVDSPGIARRTATLLSPFAAAALSHADRLLMLLVFAAIVRLTSDDTEPARSTTSRSAPGISRSPDPRRP